MAGRFALADMERLAPLLSARDGDAEFSLRFHRERGRVTAEGRVAACLPLTCQRCLEALALKVERPLRWMFVSGPEEASRVPEEYDPIELEDDQIALRELVEDELLLAIPDFPRHEDGACQPPASVADEGFEARAADEHDRENPFAALNALLDRD